jgi:hypothetical protein
MGLTSMELADRCPDDRMVFPNSPCANCGCEYAINQPGYMNCTFVASEVSEHTLEEIGEMMGITREGVRLIQIRALKKVRLAMDEENNEPALHQQSSPPGEDNFGANGQGVELSNQPNGVSDFNGRELAQR